MSMTDHIKSIAVAGAGAMGAGIAQVFAQAGYEVRIYDVNSAQLGKAISLIADNLQKATEKGKLSEKEKAATLARIQFTTAIETLNSDVIIEAIVEN
jgi:3-hydroxybutyryl-CoA dehydrogenase